ncbi:MAG TPA: VWA domain-containing protein, partial [Thermoanaerobaculia bacterium]
MRTFLAASILLLAAAAYGQDLAEKIDVTLVNVDVTVTSKNHSVRDLTRDDFEVFEDGKPQTITNFYAVENATAASKEADVAASRTPAPAVDERFRRRVLVLVDYVHTPQIERNQALQKLEQFIDDRFTAGEYDWSIAIAGLDMRLILPLTSDKARIRAALEAMRHRIPFRMNAGAPFQSLDIRLPQTSHDAMIDPMFTYFSYRAVVDAIRAFGASDGKKIVLLLSGGFGKGIDFPNLGSIMGRPPGRKLMTLRDEIIHEANASNANLYIIDPEGVSLKNGTGALYWIGRETGGGLLAGNYPEESLRKFDELTSNFYSLAYRPTHPEDFKYHRITVRLKRSGSYDLRYRDGYGALSVESQLVRTLLTPHAATMQASSFPLTFKTGVLRTAKGGETLLPVFITVPLKNLQFVPSRSGSEARVALFVSVFDEDGKTLGVQSFETRAHANRDEPTNHGELTHTALIRLTP